MAFRHSFLLLGVLAFIPSATANDSWWNTPEVRACCSQADAVIADIWRIQPDGSVLATVTDGTQRTHEWAGNVIGKTFLVPANKVIRTPGNPMGRALLFIGPHSGQVFCFAFGPLI